MLNNIGLYSYGAAALAYLLLTALVLATWRGRTLGWPVFFAGTLTAIWASICATSTLQDYPLVTAMQVAEVARNAGWLYLLLELISLRLAGTDFLLASRRRWMPWFVVGTAVLAALPLVPEIEFSASWIDPETHQALLFSASMGMAIFGLLLLEQLFRNSEEEERWSIKHLCLGLGVIFAFDFFIYAEALLFRELDSIMWNSRGAITALAAVFLTVAVGRIDRAENQRQESSRSILVSRHVAFHSVTLLAAGIYLLMMAVVGYFIRYLGGSWGGVLQVVFLSAAGLLMLALLFSGKIRARTRVWLSKNFFSYKYDYRIEWLEFTQTLASAGNNIPENIVQAIANLTKSPAGLLWSRTEENRFDLCANWEMPEPEGSVNLLNLPAWLQESQWVIDLQEWRKVPELYQGLEMPALIDQIPRAWLIVPLMFGDQLQGIILLRESDLEPEINWEDRDLLKVAGRQAASHLAQYQANHALVEARQFEAFNRLSAYVIHDLKNILAQQSLIVSNAEKHRDNPAFIDDMIGTVRNSVERMTRLMDQMRSGEREKGLQHVALCELVQDAVSQRERNDPSPTLENCDDNLLVSADREHLTTVFTHMIQNAQEATGKGGQVTVRLREEAGSAIVEVEDNGIGMDEEFLRDRLFKPFDSTKGLTGMGIGAFESRELVRNLGGDIRVSSTPGEGSLFRIVLPCVRDDTEFSQNSRAATGDQTA